LELIKTEKAMETKKQNGNGQWEGMHHAYLRRNLWIPKSFSGGKKINANVTALE
jgi:hypothetical protein